MRKSFLAVLALSLSCVAAHADTFNFNLNGGTSGFSGSGTLTGTSQGNGVFLITGISGTGVTGLIPVGGFNGNDNLLYTTSAGVFDGKGLGFTDQNSTGSFQVDLYFSGGNYFAYVAENTGGFTTTVPVQFTISNASVTPEPSSIILLGTGLLGMAGMVRRRFAK